MPTFKTIILTMLTFMMLVLYAGLVIMIIGDARSCGKCEPPTQRLVFALNSVQSLVSALVISVLAISKTGQALNLKFLGVSSPTADWLAIAYASTWLVIGGAAFVYGQFILPEEHIKTFAVLVDLGTAWFGLAIAAAYAYLGIEP